jgi:hypothetical protein
VLLLVLVLVLPFAVVRNEGAPSRPGLSITVGIGCLLACLAIAILMIISYRYLSP